MKFNCYQCDKETEFDHNDYIGFGGKQKMDTVIKFETMKPKVPKSKVIVVNCSNPDCKKPNKLTIKYYE